ncbi:MAG: hypothetical protein M3R61_00185 [Chloroflexota bacterium]|nr:hypothetical protein [Chloroflexota bacterium]
MTANRATVRSALASLITAYVTSAQIVYDHEPGDLGTASPIVVLASAGSDRTRMTFQGNQSAFSVAIDIYTLAAETASGAYSYADSADVVDACEAELADLVASQQENGFWSQITYAGPSSVEFGIFGADGIPRFRERIALNITLFS